MAMKKYTTETFIDELRKIYKDKYDYSKVNYTRNKTSVILICNTCKKEFKAIPYNLLRKQSSCPYCRYSRLSVKYRLSKEEFIKKAKEVHKDKYDYSKVDYYNNKTKVEIICKRCGNSFKITPNAHIHSGQGCSFCNRNQITKSQFIKRAREIHKDKYDYSKVVWKNKSTKVEIICKLCGNSFYQRPHDHLRGKGCSVCAKRRISIGQTYSLEEFIKKAKEIHNDKYDYSKVNYLNCREKVIIKCNNCGREFSQMPYIHLQGSGCFVCEVKNSSQEEELFEFLNSLGLKFIRRDRSLIYPYELDFYIPDYKVAIEFDGLYWHSFGIDDLLQNKIDKEKHLRKTELCELKGIKLFHIFENEWLNKTKREIWKSILKNSLNRVERKIYARECTIKEVDDVEYRQFIEKTHLQGYIPAKYKVGLFYKNNLVSIMAVGKSRFSKLADFELLRFSSDLDVQVIGGFSKLLKYLLKKYNIISLVSYADRRYTFRYKNVYLSCGFVEIKISKPNYYYFRDKRKLLSRISFQKHKLKKLLSNYDESKSEMENVLSNGYRVVFDCGNLVYLYRA